MSVCPNEDILERMVATADDASSAEWSAHVVQCSRCRSWLADARADDAMLATVRQAWSRGKNGAASGDRIPARASDRKPHRLDDSRDERLYIPGFEILRSIGEGGMGVVYEARQAQPNRIVAIKVVRGGASASEFRNRLIEHEAAALARLRHAHIAAVYSAGRTDQGLFYVAMERIHGLRVTDFAAAARLSLRQRLSLIESICRAIQHAHQHGVVHGDLKPGNILMDLGTPSDPLTSSNPLDAGAIGGGVTLTPTDIEAATVKVLDFGLSRLVDVGEPALSGVSPTRIRGTPAYMSPEQAAVGGAEIDYRSDIYSLGAVACELLTGRQPLELNGLTLDAALARVREGAVDWPGRDSSNLPGDIEAILMKALARDPAGRYSTVADLADDIRRFLSREPIRARPASRLYHARCFVRRHALGCAFAATMVLGLIGFAAAELAHARRFARERDAAQYERDRAVRVSTFMQNMIADLDPSHTGGPDISLRSVLDDAAARVETDLANDPLTAADTQLAIGQSYMALGLLVQAEAQFRSALTRRESVHGPEHADVAEAVHELGLTLKLANRPDDAEPLYQQALDMRRRLLPADDPGIAESLNDLGTLRFDQGRYAEAAAFFREALALRKARFGDQDKEYAVGLGNLAMIHFFQGEAAIAEPMVRQAIELRRKHFGEHDPVILKQLTSWTYMAMHRGGDPAVTETLVRELLERQKRLLGPDHPNVRLSTQNLAILLRKRGDDAGARAVESELRESK